MVVRSITARQNRKTGRVAVTFEIDRETWANMGRAAEDAAHPDTLDYVAGRINMAFVEDAPGPAPAAAKAMADKPGAGQGGGDDSDLDDGIPF
jgi:hypothetical protein